MFILVLNVGVYRPPAVNCPDVHSSLVLCRNVWMNRPLPVTCPDVHYSLVHIRNVWVYRPLAVSCSDVHSSLVLGMRGCTGHWRSAVQMFILLLY